VSNPAHVSSRPGARLVPRASRALLVLVLVGSRLPAARAQLAAAPPSASTAQIAPGPDAGVPATLSEQANPGEFNVLTPGSPARGALDEPLQYGPVIFRPRVTYRYLYSDGLQASPGNQSQTVVQDLSPGLLVDLGRDWVFDYAPTLRFYSDPAFRDGVDQFVDLHGGVTFDHWRFGLSQSYSDSSSPTVETGSQVDTQGYVTGLNTSFEVNPVISLDLGGSQNFQFASGSTSVGGLQSTREWSTMNFLNFRFWQDFTFGAGAGGGYVASDNSPNQVFEQYQGRFGWRITDKTSLQASAGLDDRQFSGGGPSFTNPTYGATLQYQLFQYTALFCNLNQAVTQSILQDSVTVGTTYGAGLSQRLLGKLRLSVSGNYSTEDFLSTQTGMTDRTDHAYTFNSRLSCPFLKRGTLGLTWQYSHNQSTENGLTYGATQLGFDVGYSY
jgi:hypothetical protein